MGTRNLTMVIDEKNNFKVAQYGQWDGYPSGQGLTALEFARNKQKMDKLKFELDNIRFIEEDSEIWAYGEEYNTRFKNGTLTEEDKYWFDNTQTRDLCASILDSIITLDKTKLPKEMNGLIYLSDNRDFGKNSLFCEWAYCINFRTNTLDCYCSNKIKSKQSKLFYADDEIANENGGYYGIRCIKQYDLDNLPTDEEFVSELEKLESECE